MTTTCNDMRNVHPGASGVNQFVRPCCACQEHVKASLQAMRKVPAVSLSQFLIMSCTVPDYRYCFPVKLGR